MSRWMHPNTKAVLSCAVPMVIVGIVLGFIPRDFRHVAGFYQCMSKGLDLDGGADATYDYCMNVVAEGDALSVYMAVIAPALGLVCMILAILFIVISVFSCGAITCVKYSARVFVTLFFALLVDTGYCWGAYFVVDYEGGAEEPSAVSRAYADFFGAHSVGQYLALAAGWAVTGLLAPFLTAGNKFCAKVIVIVLGAAVTAAMMELLIWADYWDVICPISGETSETDFYLVGLGIALPDALIFVVQAFFCFCGAHLRGCCCCKKGEKDEGLLDESD